MNPTLDRKTVRERTTREILSMPICTRHVQALGTIQAMLLIRKKGVKK